MLYLPGTVTVPPNTQMHVDTHIRLRFPEGVSGSYWNLISAAEGNRGRCIPIGCSYNGTITITVANPGRGPLLIDHNNPAAIVVVNVADAALSLQSSRDIFTDNTARHFKKRLFTDTTKTVDTMRGWRFLLHSDPSSKPVGSILTPAAKNTPRYTWALAPTGEHSFAFFHPKLPFSQQTDQIGKTGGISMDWGNCVPCL